MNCFCIGIVHESSETMNMISTNDHHELVLVFMPCYNADLMLMSMFYQQIEIVYLGNSNNINGSSNT